MKSFLNHSSLKNKTFLFIFFVLLSIIANFTIARYITYPILSDMTVSIKKIENIHVDDKEYLKRLEEKGINNKAIIKKEKYLKLTENNIYKKVLVTLEDKEEIETFVKEKDLNTWKENNAYLTTISKSVNILLKVFFIGLFVALFLHLVKGIMDNKFNYISILILPFVFSLIVYGIFFETSIPGFIKI